MEVTTYYLKKGQHEQQIKGIGGYATPTRFGSSELPTVIVRPIVHTFPGCTSGITLILLPAAIILIK